MVEKNKKYDIKVPYKIIDQIGLLKRLNLNLPNFKHLKLLLEEEALHRFKIYFPYLKDEKSNKFKNHSKFYDLEILKKFETKLRFILLEKLGYVENHFKNKICRALIKFRVGSLYLGTLDNRAKMNSYIVSYKLDEANVISLVNGKNLGELGDFIDDLSFGRVLNLYLNLDNKVKSAVIKSLNLEKFNSISYLEIEFLMKIFVSLRNKCAHHKHILDLTYNKNLALASKLNMKIEHFHSLGPIIYFINIFLSSMRTKSEEYGECKSRLIKLLDAINSDKDASQAFPNIYKVTNLKKTNLN